MREVQYIADDGTPFSTEDECLEYEFDRLVDATRVTWATDDGALGGPLDQARFVYLPSDGAVNQFYELCCRSGMISLGEDIGPDRHGFWMYDENCYRFRSMDAEIKRKQAELLELIEIQKNLAAASQAKIVVPFPPVVESEVSDNVD